MAKTTKPSGNFSLTHKISDVAYAVRDDVIDFVADDDEFFVEDDNFSPAPEDDAISPDFFQLGTYGIK